MHVTLAHDNRAQRDEVVRLGLWMFLATVAMLFAAFGSAYLVRRGSSDWSRLALPSVVWLNTAVLASSSLVLEGGWALGRRRRWTAASAALGVVVGLGVGFLGGQLTAWRALMARGVFLPDSPNASFFYVLTGAHGVHVLAALVLISVSTLRTWMGLGRRDYALWARLLDASRAFWHFLFATWVFVLVLLFYL